MQTIEVGEAATKRVQGETEAETGKSAAEETNQRTGDREGVLVAAGWNTFVS